MAWIIAPRFASSDLHRWMRALYNRVRTKDPTWKLAGFIVDDPLSDVLTIRLGAKSTTLILDMAKYLFEVLYMKKNSPRMSLAYRGGKGILVIR